MTGTTRVYLVRAGTLENDHVVYENVVAFTTRREAETLVREAKRDEPYEHQYDDVEEIRVYRSRRRWLGGLQQRSTRAARKRRS